MKKITILCLSIALLFGFNAIGFATNQPSQKDETIYAALNYNGSVEKITVVNRLYSPFSGNQLVDYGTYTNIQNLSNDVEPKVSGDTIIFDGSEEIYYEGQTTGELPYVINIKYFLNNKEVSGNQLAGQDGNVKIEIDVAPNEKASKELRTGLMAQLSTTLSMDKAKNLSIDNGFYVVAGKSYNISFVAMGENPSKFAITFDTTDFSMGSISINVIKSSFNADDIIGDTKDQLLSAFDDIADGVSQAKEGTQELQSGTKDIAGAINKLSGGLNTLNSSGTQINSGMSSYLDGLNMLSQSLPALTQGSTAFGQGLNSLTQGLPSMLQGYVDLYTGVHALSQGHIQLDTAANTALNQVVPALNQVGPALTQAAPGLAQLGPALDQIVPALDQLVTAGMLPPEVSALVSQASSAVTQTSQLVGGAGALVTETSTLVKGLSEGIKAETQGITQIDGGLQSANTEFGKIVDGVKTLNTNYVQLDSGIQLLPQGIQSLKDGFIQIQNGVAQYTSGISEIAGGANTLKNGTASLPKDVQKLVDGQGEIVDGVNQGKDEISEKVDEFTKDTDLPPVSFASAKNTPTTVQYMMHTPEIYKEKVSELPAEEDDSRNFIDKLVDLFKPQL